MADGTRDGSASVAGTAARGELSRLLVDLARPAAPEARAGPPPLPGDRVGRFEVVREVGRGGFGAVYEAQDTALGRRVALKTVRPGRGSVPISTLEREAEAIARLEHPGIVTIHDVGTSASGPFLVIELLRGETLAARLRRGPVPLETALRIALDVADALAHAHERGVLHRDLTPSNVFLCEGGRVKLLDFGLAHLLRGDAPALPGGTPDWVAPEQWRGGTVDERADVYAAATILAKMLPAGRPRALASVLAAARSEDPSRRPKDGAAWRDALRRASASLVRRRRVLRGAPVAVALTLALAALALVSRPGRGGAGALTVALADASNETGRADLDGAAALLALALEPSSHVRALSPGRAFALLEASEGGPPARIDERAARELARRAGAKAVLVTRVREELGAFRLDVRAVEPGGGGPLFDEVTERAATPAELLSALDRLAARVRVALGEPAPDVQAAAVPISQRASPRLDALAAYVEGTRCRDRALTGCAEHFARAASVDPSFALAQLDLAMSVLYGGDFTSRGVPALREAQRHAHRLPRGDRLRIEALAALADGEPLRAARLVSEAAAASPDDPFVQLAAGEAYVRVDDLAAALPHLRRADELDPRPGDAKGNLVDALGVLGPREELARLVARLEAAPGNAGALLRAMWGRAFLGDRAGAVATGRRLVASLPPGAERDGMRAELWIVRTWSGDAGLEEEIREACGAEPDYQLFTLRALEGRRAEALRIVDEGRPECRGSAERPALGLHEETLFANALRVRYLAGVAGAGGLWAHARKAAERNAVFAPHLAVYLAYAGDLEHAQELARGLPEGSHRRAVYDAVVLWRTDRRAEARERLEALAARNPWSDVPHALPASFLAGELAAELGDAAAAVRWLERFEALPFVRLDFWAWAYPKSLYLRARAYEQLGRPAEARAAIDRLVALWRRADPDLPLVQEARELARRLSAPAR